MNAREDLNMNESSRQSPAAESAQAGRYILHERIGSGGAATVYRAYDRDLGRTVAVKALTASADMPALQRFQREAATAIRLKHPHIVPTLHVGLGEGGVAAYIAMTLVEGESLARLLGRVGKLSPSESCALLAPIARALDYAHAQEIIHRDVKPSNILLRPVAVGFTAGAGDPGGGIGGVTLDVLDYPVYPLLSDFGIARALDAPELTHIGRTVGTPAFMSPEQCAGTREVDGRADIYALGAVLFRCILGHAPFRGSNHEVLHAHVYGALTVEAARLVEMPVAVIDILQRSLAKDTGDRYARAADMADALQAVAHLRTGQQMYVERAQDPALDGVQDDGEDDKRAVASPDTSNRTGKNPPEMSDAGGTASTTSVHAVLVAGVQPEHAEDDALREETVLGSAGGRRQADAIQRERGASSQILRAGRGLLGWAARRWHNGGA